MGELTDFIKEYFEITSEEQLKQDWEELKKYNEQGSDILDMINTRDNAN